jgi:hypothetical protein
MGETVSAKPQVRSRGAGVHRRLLLGRGHAGVRLANCPENGMNLLCSLWCPRRDSDVPAPSSVDGPAACMAAHGEPQWSVAPPIPVFQISFTFHATHRVDGWHRWIIVDRIERCADERRGTVVIEAACDRIDSDLRPSFFHCGGGLCWSSLVTSSWRWTVARSASRAAVSGLVAAAA